MMQSDNCYDKIGLNIPGRVDIIISILKVPMKRTEEIPFVILRVQS